jgi:Cell Wall Hydrolase
MQDKYPDTLREIIQQKDQFPWASSTSSTEVCKRPEDIDLINQRAWDVVIERAQLIWNARDMVWHNYPCFYSVSIKGKYPIARNKEQKRYGSHIFWDCS